MRQFTTTLTLTLVISAALAACGSEVGNTRSGTSPTSSSTSSSAVPPKSLQDLVVDARELVSANGILMQRTVNGPVELCLGGVAESYPPQCGGPRLVGEFDWEPLNPARAGGVTWTNGSAWVVGHYDPSDGPNGSVTLERPVSLSAPPEVEIRSSTLELTFPQLCKDPYAGGGRKGAGSSAEQEALGAMLPTLDGYVGSWVSDGASMFNVLVTDDADATRTRLRKVWPGGLCVEQRDVATEADVRAAQEALGSRLKGLLSTSGDGMTGTLNVVVTLLDQATLDGILKTVRPWLAPEDLSIAGAFQPLTR